MIAKKKILAVDDVAINLSMIENALKGQYDVVTVNSGSRALRYLARETPDLILLDIRMQYKDGIETLQEIRAMEDKEHIPVIMLTSAQDRETVLASAQLGVFDYVLKPFDTEDLRRRIQRALNDG